MENNQAFVAKLGNIRPIPGADNIVAVDVILNDIPITQVIVSKGVQENTPVVYFDANLALEDEFIEAIDKLSPNFGKEGFKSIGAYLAKGNRVRCIKLKGVISNGLAIEVEKVARIVQKKDFVFKEGFSFTELPGIKVCHKWLPPVKKEADTAKGMKFRKKKAPSRIVPETFHFYVETAQLLRNLHELSPNDVVSISRKLHGTSAIASRTLVYRPLSFRDKIAKFLGVAVLDKEYDTLYASRSVIKNDAQNPGGFYKSDIWTEVGSKHFAGKLHAGETVYYEIVGYIPGTRTMIQKDYDYGNKPGEYSIAVYRITMTSPDGTVTSLDWAAMKERCKELLVPTVEEFYYGRLGDLAPIPEDENWHKNLVQFLRDKYLEKDVWDNLGKKVPDEGIVLRVEGLGIRVYKLKSERFYAYESAARETETPDIEAEEGNAR